MKMARFQLCMLLATCSQALAVEPSPPAAPAPASQPDAAGIEFFEKHVRPVLAQHCFKCHGAEKQQAGLRLDSRAALLKGSDTMRVVAPGKPAESPMITAIGYTEDPKMPPDGKLPQAAIEALTQWVKLGAPFPDQPAGAPAHGKLVDDGRWKAHWAFQPIKSPNPPAVKNAAWPQSPIDNFILTALEQQSMTPAKPADRRVLLRRVTLDLVGLPPTFEEVEAFAADSSPDAFAKVVDRLLASPHYGERWGRHWLDVARYADTKGYVFMEDRNYPFAYTYRDWVVGAFNQDLPYDQFLLQQIAADGLPRQDESSLAAMGFLTLGRRFINNKHDIIDDRLDVVTRGTLALTVTCARCHDHKYDPIPTADYYSLYGVFAGSSERQAPLSPPSAEYQQGLQAREKATADFLQAKHGELLVRLRGELVDYLLAAHSARKQPSTDQFDFVQSDKELNPRMVMRWRNFLDKNREPLHRVLAPWHELDALAETEFAPKSAELAERWKSLAAENKLNPLVAKAFATPPASHKEAAERYARLFAEAEAAWGQAVEAAAKQQMPAPAALADAALEEVRQVLLAGGSPTNVPLAEADQFFDKPTNDKLRELRAEFAKWSAAGKSPTQALILEDAPQQSNPRVLVRGNPTNTGPEVPRQFLAVLSGPDRRPFQKGSGRLEMAQQIVSKDNPLTARVLVNRVWLEHFGEGLVRTPSDFGLRSDPPTHPELLDYLASRFMSDGWSIKKLHRLILLSSTYRQASQNDPAYGQRDPENKLVWRMNRRRLDFESLRDSLLAVSGKIDLSAGGPAVNLTSEPFTGRRTLYGMIDRQNLAPIFRTFDFASPDTHSPRRFQTTVPQQALFLLNSPFVAQQAQALATRGDVQSLEDRSARLERVYRLVLGRAPNQGEAALAAEYLSGEDLQSSPWQYGAGSYDPASDRLKNFMPFRHWTGQNWQMGAALPDAHQRWVSMFPGGGHPGGRISNGGSLAAVRRWIAPRDAALQIAGPIEHSSSEGDGITARVISSRSGQLAQWTVRHGKVEGNVDRLEVKQGDTIDFIVECQVDDSYDRYLWAPIIRQVEPQPASPAAWDSKVEFHGPPPIPGSAWEKLVQVLLLSNEFAFVD